ncbi:hypothetical protein [Azospirillum sp. TSO22-1]|uniref:hypothetical protein n=1 Tax=Azospirillum sp. TSO22-1 TaxID=716789 RepID=UPI000D608C28|nr:hypothetical protein [Azospirillum sp. TSO22-1]PWC52539.1 hypothetical protein TSO221_13890 [Azospirillum sp. TSO22-1]
MSEGRSLFAALARGETPPRPPFLPLVEALAARVAGYDPAALEADPDRRARAVRQATALVGGDALCLGFDPAMAADEGRFARLADTLVRAFEPARGSLGCVAALAGPATLARLTAGDAGKEGLEAARPALTRMTEAVCKTRPDLIVFLEDAEARGVPVDGALKRAYAAARKVAAYYDVATAVLADGWEGAADEVRRLAPLGLDYAWLGPGASDADPAAVAGALGEGNWRGAVLPLPLEDSGRAAALAEITRRCAGDALVLALSSAGPLAADADLERIMETKTALGALHR